MITRNLRLVVSVARQFVHSGIPLTDLIQEGNIGLMRPRRVRAPEHTRDRTRGPGRRGDAPPEPPVSGGDPFPEGRLRLRERHSEVVAAGSKL